MLTLILVAVNLYGRAPGSELYGRVSGSEFVREGGSELHGRVEAQYLDRPPTAEGVWGETAAAPRAGRANKLVLTVSPAQKGDTVCSREPPLRALRKGQRTRRESIPLAVACSLPLDLLPPFVWEGAVTWVRDANAVRLNRISART